MSEAEGVAIVEGTIQIDHPEIEAGLNVLAGRWRITTSEALARAVEQALAAYGG